MAYYFNESYYIKSKLAQLKSNNLTYTEDQLKSAIAQAYEQPYSEDLARQHYEDYGRAEGLNPNPYFNEYEYLLAKTNQLNSIGEENRYGGGAWTVDDVLRAMLEDGMIPAEHYERYGCYETDASGRYINPSNAFDANAYWSAKLYQLQATEPDAGWTMASMIARFQKDGLSPVSHYAAYGHEEVTEDYAFVQTVPVSQRMSNDPLRDDIGDIVPTNYMDGTPRPRDNNARPAEKPADVGGLVTDEDISPPPVYPEKSAPVPGDADYVAPPSTIRDGYGVNVLPPATTGTGNASDHWIVVDDDSDTGVVMDRYTGRVLGQVNLEKTEVDGRITATLPEEENRPEGWLDPTDKDELPPGVNPNYDLNNNFTSEPGPDPDETGITAAFDGNGDLIIGNTVKETGSSVTLDEDGNMSWTGYQDGAVKPAQPLADGKTLDASATTEEAGGTGLLTLTSAKTSEHSIIGSNAVSNHISLASGAKSIHITGGDANDTIHIAKGATVAGIISTRGGDDVINLGADTYSLEILDTYGNNAINLDNAGTSLTLTGLNSVFYGTINGGVGKDTIAFSGTVSGAIDGGDGDDVIHVSGHMNGSIYGGQGNDAITLHADAQVDGSHGDSIFGGDGDDTITLAGIDADKIALNLDGGAGMDLLVLDADYNWYSQLLAQVKANTFEALTVKAGRTIDGLALESVNVNGVTCTLEQGVTIKDNLLGSTGSDTINLGEGTWSLSIINTEGANVLNLDNAGANVTLLGISDFHGTVNGDDGNDSINIEGAVIGTITLGKGADSINLTNKATTVAIAEEDTGAYADPGGAEFTATACDVIQNPGANTKLSLGANWTTPGALAPQASFQEVGNNSAMLFTGTYSGTTFTEGAGNDRLLAYDADPGGNTAVQAVVLVGAAGLTATMVAGGDITLTT